MNENLNSDQFCDFTNALSNGLSKLHDVIYEAFSPLTSPQFLQLAVNTFAENANQLASVLACSVLENYDYELISNALQDISRSLSSYVFASLADNISVDMDCVTITNDGLNILTNFFDEHSSDPVPKITSKMTTKDFVFCILIPLICMIVPMLQNSYYHKLDSIESQRYQLQEAEYQEAILALETQYSKELDELNTNFSELLQYLESAQDTDSPDANTPSLPPDVQETSFDSPVVENETVDGTDNHEMN